MPFSIIRNDITQMHVDAIVNAANSHLKMGSGVCSAIFSAAGAQQLQQECDRIGHCAVGKAVITGAYKLPAKFIIHTVGPRWDGGTSDEEGLLRSCYSYSLALALKHDCESIAFPLISSGIFGYPKDRALAVAVSAISEFLLAHDATVFLVVFDKKAFALSEKIFSAVEKFIDDHYVDEHLDYKRNRLEYRIREEHPSESRSLDYQGFSESMLQPPMATPKTRPMAVPTAKPMAAPTASPMAKADLADFISKLDESFAQALFRLIDEKSKGEVETYKRANIDRRLFSKIKSDKYYKPSKPTALAFAISLELNLHETRELLYKAGYALSRSSKFDLIIEFFIVNRIYDIYRINETLFYYDQALLGA